MSPTETQPAGNSTRLALEVDGWPGIEIDSWRAFLSHVSDTLGGVTQPSRYLFRGHGSANWDLVPSLLRQVPSGLDAAGVLAIEQLAQREFRAQLHLHPTSEQIPESQGLRRVVEWWAMMQHHGAPTRLLDWTASPYVAAYFAAADCPDEDGLIFLVERSVLGAEPDLDKETVTNPSALPRLAFFSPARKTPRIVAQQGYFSVSPAVLSEHRSLITAAQAGRYWLIPRGLKPEFLRQLRVANIAAHSLFPGLDGLGRSVAELVRSSPAALNLERDLQGPDVDA